MLSSVAFFTLQRAAIVSGVPSLRTFAARFTVPTDTLRSSAASLCFKVSIETLKLFDFLSPPRARVDSFAATIPR
jgi:hypothetical protein